MKLRNKKTGDIVIAHITRMVSGVEFDCGQTLTELNEEWEDYEEPKEYWYIDTTEGAIVEHTCEQFELTDKERKEIGNYFETKEEAEQAVEKLKAWKRLKDKGFRFKTWGWEDSSNNEYTIYFTLDSKTGGAFDLDLLFGGEE